MLRVSLFINILWLRTKRFLVAAETTRGRVRHAAMGRARTSASYIGRHTTACVGNNMHASDLIAYLRRERQQMAFATYGVPA